MATGVLDAPRGLKGLIVAETSVGDVRGEEGFYHYRQYAAPDLAATRTFEDVWWLLFEGELPTAEQRAAFQAEVGLARRLPAELLDLLPAIAARRAVRWRASGPRSPTSPTSRGCRRCSTSTARGSGPTSCASARRFR